MGSHKDYTGDELHQPWNYWQEDDPGAVGVKRTWYKESTKELTYRNSSDTAWVPVLSAPATTTLPSGVTSAGIQSAINAAATGSTILLPDEVITQTGGLAFGSKNLTLSGSGPSSELRADRDISQDGSGVQLYIRDTGAAVPSTVTLRNLIVSHDRANVGRIAMVRIKAWGGTVNFDNVTFNDATANIFELVGGHCHTVNIRGCTANEWYEGFLFGPSVSGCDNLTVSDCVGTCTAGSPTGGVSRPQFLLLSNESATDAAPVNNVVVTNNRFIGDLGTSFNNSTGIAIKNGTNGTQIYQNVYIYGNHIEGFQINEIQRYHSFGGGVGGAEGRCLMHVFRNKFISDNSVRTFWIRLELGSQAPSTVKDRIFFGDNDLCKSTGAGNLVIEDTASLAATVLVTGDPPNKLYQLPFPAMTSDITESFTTGDGDTLGPDLSWTEVAGDFDIVTNKAQLITRGTDSRARAETSLGSADHYVSCVLNQSARTSFGSVSKTKIGVIARWDASDTNYYQAWIDYKARRVVLANKALVHIAGVRINTLLSNVPVKLTLRCKGSLIAVFIDDVPVIVEVDTSVATGNFTGIQGFDSLDASTRVLTYSEFEAGTV